eukprot:CAMPEP_0202866794 /NCGR_PEP_ID=MMETSP1391-20130828/8365_1 /ASSEMBLY_ACC=CAM_ASM_000867 /TAXON_ID=1034604 /ORGANISM="Chlamydomonas leiostraca, Strain SAG 11-49" /LENGTH=272 /DNA_ID=CAMNT_0049546779 /DNA_START=101 /DNA_END=919 /DNA_ORIENTATION=-
MMRLTNRVGTGFAPSIANPRVMRLSQGLVQTKAAHAPLPTTPYREDLVNKVMLTGYTGRDTEFIENHQGTVARFTMAVNQGTKDNRKSQWFDVWLENPELAEQAKAEVVKGTYVHVQGRMIIDDNKNPSVIAELVLMVDKSLDDEGQAAPAPAPAARAPARAAAAPVPSTRAAAPRAATTRAAAPKASQPVAGSGAARVAAASGDVPDWRALQKEDQWRLVVERPELWWDNRTNKRSERGPDFKWKADKEGPALWLSSKDTPDWAREQLSDA